LQIPVIKKVLKIVPAKVNVEFSDEIINGSKEQKNYEYFQRLIKDFKSDGLSVSEIIAKLDEECKEYNINFISLPKMVYKLYGE
jgi:hypothetical protein